MVDETALGAFLKARRGRLRPADVGLASSSRRRVPGLRREELAALAGISTDYYLRIEQGRVAHPSAQVLDALARVLRLDERSAVHLRQLAGLGEPIATDEADLVEPGLQELLDQLDVPAYIVSRYLDCLASNALARALSPNYAPGHNLLRQLFVDPAERALHLDWNDAAASVVGGLRQVAGAASSDPRLNGIVYDLSERSDEFRMLWSRAEVGYRPSGDSHMLHPLVGELHLQRRRFDLPESGGQHIHLYFVEPGSESAERLNALRGR
ncbi:helix-turn-helix domain-containing protein [Leifsonia poae]|uniref:helix-turn-helix domain-containing protein n=1 Tax=Leifsonia poae TaxID=110933 RepID=UPI003D670CEE